MWSLPSASRNSKWLFPGLEAEDTPSVQAVPTDNSLNAESKLVIQALGGAENIGDR